MGGMLEDGAAVQRMWGWTQQGILHWETAALITLGFSGAPQLPLQERHGLAVILRYAAPECASEYLCMSSACP